MFSKSRKLQQELEDSQEHRRIADARALRCRRVIEELLETSKRNLLLLDMKGAILAASRPARRMLREDAQKQQPARSFSRLFHCEDDWDWSRIVARLPRQDQQSPLEVSAVLAQPKERPRSLELSFSLLDSEPAEPRILVTVTSPEEEASTRELFTRFQSAVEQTLDSVLITDRRGRIEYVNPAFERITGYSSEEILGKNPRVLKSGRHSAHFYEHFWSVISSGETFRHLFKNRRKNGDIFYMEMTITPILDARGSITHFVGSGRDVTARYQREREQESVLALSSEMRSARKLTEMIPIILDQILRLMDVRAAALTRAHEVDDQSSLLEARGDWAELEKDERRVLEELSNHVLDERCPYLTEQLSADPRFGSTELDRLPCLAAVPLRSHEQAIGSLLISDDRPIREADLQLLISLGDLAGNAIHRVRLHEQTEKRLQRLTALHAIDLTITSSSDLKANLGILLGHVQTQLNVDAASVLLLDKQSRTMEYISGRGFRTDQVQQYHLPIGEGAVGEAVLSRDIVQLNELLGEQQERIRKPPLLDEEFRSYHVTPLIAKEEVKGVLEIFHREPMQPDSDWLAFLEIIGTQAAIAIDNATMFDHLRAKKEQLADAYDATIEGWARALEMRDGETEGHAKRVTDTTMHLARKLGVPECRMIHVQRGALLHDIGKLGIPDSILMKPGPLSDAEWKIMRRHPTYAERMLSHVEYLRPAIDIPSGHHERWDGTGYPRGLQGRSIPQAARVFAVIDVWDALRSDRPYRPAWDEDRVVSYIRELSGQHFDPEIVEVFAEEIDHLQELARRQSAEEQQRGNSEDLIRHFGTGHRLSSAE